MRKIYPVCAMLLTVITACSKSYDEPKYSVIKSDPPFEVRQYEGYIEAFVTVDNSSSEAGNEAFPILFDYISGNNGSQQEIKMTAPVTQEPQGVKIKMTAPVTQREDGDTYRVAFVMPSKWTLETLPVPKDSRVSIADRSPSKVAVVTYSGTWSKSNYDEHLARLQGWMKKENLRSASSPVWARYNSPFSLWFTRRNEIQIRVE
jgi:hypothetical protein